MPSPAQQQVAVSYSWREEDKGANHGAVKAFCEQLRQLGVDVIRDLNRLKHGDCISKFMRSIGASDFLCVFLSEAYLKSPNCMYELLIAWQCSKDNPEQFRSRVKVWVMRGVGISQVENRLAFLEHWKAERDRVVPLIEKHATDGLAPAELETFRRTQQIAEHVNEMLLFFADTLSPQSVDEFRNWVGEQFPDGAKKESPERRPVEVLEKVFMDIDKIVPLPQRFVFSNSVFPGTSAVPGSHADRAFSLSESCTSETISDACAQTPMVSRTAIRNMRIETLVRQLTNNFAMLVFVGSQGIGKTWLAHQLVHGYCKKADDHDGIRIIMARVGPADVIGPTTRGQRTSNTAALTDFFALYAAWAKKFVRCVYEDLKPPERDNLRKHALIQDLDDYMENISIVIKDLKDRRSSGSQKSIVSVLADSIYQILGNCDIKLPDQFVGVLGVDDVYAYEFKYESVGRTLIAAFKKSLDEEVELQSMTPRGQVETRLKIIVTTRQLEVQFEKPTIPLIAVGYFSLEECTQFVEEHLSPHIPDPNQRSSIAKEAHSATNGYPWFFYRYLEATLFVYLNASKTLPLSKILSIVRNSSVFWAYNVRFDEDFRHLLGESIDDELPKASGDDGRFFAPIREAFRRNTDLNATYERAISEMSRHDILRTPSSGTKRDILPLIQVGLLGSEAQGDAYRLWFTNDIVASFFNPAKLRDLSKIPSREIEEEVIP